MTIHVLNKFTFDAMVQEAAITDDNVTLQSKFAYICIVGTMGDVEPYFKRDHENALRLFFDDVESGELVMLENGTPAQPFDDFDGRALLQFLEKQKERGTAHLFVHCMAGKCRSGAVGAFAADFFGVPYADFQRLNPQVNPNATVLSVMKQIVRRENLQTFAKIFFDR